VDRVVARVLETNDQPPKSLSTKPGTGISGPLLTHCGRYIFHSDSGKLGRKKAKRNGGRYSV